jgi:hypothetical protein
MMIWVTSVQPVPDFKLQLCISNGECPCFDMEPYLNLPVYRRLDNPGFFALARVDYGTVVWPDEIDIAPESLYDRPVPLDKAPA